MIRRNDTIGSGYFDQLYRDHPDPWAFETSPYEQEKYAATLSLLRAEPYGNALEVGCAIGVLTAQLARYCTNLLAVDASEIALERARARGLPSFVRFEKRMVPAEFPDGQFDLILLSEIVYYLAVGDLQILARQCSKALLPGGAMILCHWLGETDYPLTGIEASDLFAAAVIERCPERKIVRDQTYRLEWISG